MTTSFLFRKINGELKCFIKTVGEIYINTDFIKYLTVSNSKRKGYRVMAWLDSVKGDCFVLGENFKSEADAKGFIQCLVDQFNLEKDKDTDDEYNICAAEFESWRRAKWRENHEKKPGKISLMKPLF